jgi:hypothetical protein
MNHDEERPVMLVPVRWQRDMPRLVKETGPLEAGHPLVGTGCLGCAEPHGTERSLAILAAGPDQDSDEDVEKHREGRWYAADGVVVHQECIEAAIATLDADRPR